MCPKSAVYSRARNRRAAVLLAALSAASAFSGESSGQVSSWRSASSGSWETSTNWSFNVPGTGGSTEAFVTVPGSYTITLNSTTNLLTRLNMVGLNSGTFSTLTVGTLGTLRFHGGSINTAQLDIVGGTLLLGGISDSALRIFGGVPGPTSPRVRLSGATVGINPGALGAVIANTSGTIAFYGAVPSTVNVQVQNGRTIETQANASATFLKAFTTTSAFGTLNLTGPNSTITLAGGGNAGTINVGSSSFLRIGVGTFGTPAASFTVGSSPTGTGTVSFENGAHPVINAPWSFAGTTRVAGGFVVFNAPVTGSFRVGGSFGTLAVPGSVIFNSSLSGTVHVGAGTAAVSAHIAPGGILQQGNWTLDGPGVIGGITGNATTIQLGLGGGNSFAAGFVNAGTLVSNSGFIPSAFTNTGTIKLASGVTKVNGLNALPGEIVGGTWELVGAPRLETNGVTLNRNSASLVLSATEWLSLGSLTNNGALWRRNGGTTTIPGLFFNNGIVTVRDEVVGTSTIAGGRLVLPAVPLASGALGTGDWRVVGAGSELSFGAASVVGLEAAASVTLDGTGSRFDALNTLTTNAGRFEIRSGRDFSTVAGSGTQTFTNTGTLIIGAASDFTLNRPLAVGSGGRIELASGAGTADLGRLVVNHGITTLAGGGTISSTGSLAVTGVVDLAGVTQNFDMAGGSLSVSSRIVNGSISKLGGGVLDLRPQGSINNDFDSLSIAGGTVRASTQGAIPATATVNFNSGTLEVSTPLLSVGGLSSGTTSAASQRVQLNNATLEIDANRPAQSYLGSIAGSGTFIKDGIGNQSLGSADGSLAFTGNLQVNRGQLTLAAPANSFSGGIAINNTGVLSVDNDNQLGNASNALTLGNGGTLRATGSLSTSRAIAINSSGQIDVSPGQTMQHAGTLSSVSAGTLTKVGEGVLTLDSTLNADAFSGTLSVAQAGGQVRVVGGSDLLSGVSNYKADVRGTIVFDRRDGSSLNRASGLRAGALPDLSLSGGTFTLLGENGTLTTQNFGILDLGSGASTLYLSEGTTANSRTLLSFGTFGSRATGATLNVIARDLGGNATLSTNRLTFGSFGSLSIGDDIGGWFTVTDPLSTPNDPSDDVTSFAKYTADGVVPLAAGDYVSTFTRNSHVKLTNSATVPDDSGTGGTNPYSIKTLTLDASANTVDVTIPSVLPINTLSLSQGGLIKSGTFPSSISGGTLTSSSGELNINVSAGVLSIDSQLAGAFTLTKRGGGTLQLSGTAASTYTGATIISGFLELNKTTGNAIPGDLTISGGTVKSLQNDQIIDTGCIILNAGTFDLNGKSETIRCLANNNGYLRFGGGTLVVNESAEFNGGTTDIASTLTLPSGTSELIVRSGDNTVGASGVINAGGGLRMLGSASPLITLNSGVLNLSGSVDVGGNGLGTNSLGSGTARLSSGGSTGTIDLAGAARNFNVGSFSGDSDLEVSARIRNGGIVKNGEGVMRLTSANTHALGTVINQGELEGTNNSFGSGSVAVNGTAMLSMRSNAPAGGFANPLRVNASDAAIIIGPDTPAGTPGTFAMSDAELAGTLSVGGTGTLSVATTTLVSTTTLSSYATTEITGPISGGSDELVYFPGASPAPLPGEGRSRKLPQTAAGTLILSSASATSNTFGGITQNDGTIILNRPSGIVAVSNQLTINRGTTQLRNDEQIANNALVSLTGAAAVLDLNNRTETIGLLNLTGGTVLIGTGTLILTGNTAPRGTPEMTSAISATGSAPTAIQGTIALTGTSPILQIDDGPAGEDLRLGGALVASNGFTKQGAGNLVLAGNSGSLLGGVVNLSGGTLTAAVAGSLGQATLALSGGVLAAQVPLPNRITIAGAGIINVPFGQTADISQPISGSGTTALTKSGGGRLILSAANTFTGGIRIEAGTLSFAQDNHLGNGGNSLIVADGALQYTGSSPLTISRGITSLNGGIDVSNAGATLTVTAAIAGQTAPGATLQSGNFTKYGPGTLVLQQLPTFTGTTSVRGGLLDVTATGAIDGGTLAQGRNWAVYDSATLQLAGGPISHNAADVTLSGAASSFAQLDSLTSNSGAMTITNGRAFNAAASALNNSGAINIGSAGILRTPGGLNNTGTINIQRNGVLRIGGAFDVATGTIDMNGVMIHDYDGASPITAIRPQLATAYNNGAWNGEAHLRSTAAATTSSRAIGYAEASALGLLDGSTFEGETVDATTVLLRYTIAGDADLNGTTGIADFARLAANFNLPSTWTSGDFNYDAVTNIADFALLAGNFNQSAIAGLPSISLANRGGAVPEPSSWLVAMALCSLLRQRKMNLRNGRNRESAEVGDALFNRPVGG